MELILSIKEFKLSAVFTNACQLFNCFPVSHFTRVGLADVSENNSFTFERTWLVCCSLIPWSVPPSPPVLDNPAQVFFFSPSLRAPPVRHGKTSLCSRSLSFCVTFSLSLEEHSEEIVLSNHPLSSSSSLTAVASVSLIGKKKHLHFPILKLSQWCLSPSIPPFSMCICCPALLPLIFSPSPSFLLFFHRSCFLLSFVLCFLFLPPSFFSVHPFLVTFPFATFCLPFSASFHSHLFHMPSPQLFLPLFHFLSLFFSLSPSPFCCLPLFATVLCFLFFLSSYLSFAFYFRFIHRSLPLPLLLFPLKPIPPPLSLSFSLTLHPSLSPLWW